MPARGEVPRPVHRADSRPPLLWPISARKVEGGKGGWKFPLPPWLLNNFGNKEFDKARGSEVELVPRKVGRGQVLYTCDCWVPRQAGQGDRQSADKQSPLESEVSGNVTRAQLHDISPALSNWQHSHCWPRGSHAWRGIWNPLQDSSGLGMAHSNGPLLNSGKFRVQRMQHVSGRDSPGCLSFLARCHSTKLSFWPCWKRKAGQHSVRGKLSSVIQFCRKISMKTQALWEKEAVTA